MKKVMLFFAAVFAAFCFSSCEEEKEEQVDVQQVYYRLCSFNDTEQEDIYVFEYDNNDKIVQEHFILNIGKGENTDYIMARPNTSFVVLYCKQIYYDELLDFVHTYYYKVVNNLDRDSQYNDFYFVGGEEITQEEFEAMKEQKK